MDFFVNLPVADLNRSKAFYTALGWSSDDRFGGGSNDANAACFVVSEEVRLMLTTREFFTSLIGEGGKQLGDPSATALAAYALAFPSREDVDAFVDRAEAAGATIGSTDDYGFMYQRDFQDPDGHPFAPFWMDPAGPPKA